MFIGFAIINNLKKFKLQKIIKYSNNLEIRNNKLIKSFFPESFKVANILNSYKMLNGDYINFIVDEIIISDQIYFKYDKYCVYNENLSTINLITYKEILERDKNLIKFDAKLFVDLINNYIRNKEYRIFILKLKNKYYLNLVTSSYYYIFKFKNDNFKLIKVFRYWNKFALDEKNNLYFINSLMQFYRISKSFKSYNSFVNIVNNNYYNSNSIINLYNTSKSYLIKYYYLNYKLSYKNNTIDLRIARINFNKNTFISIDNNIIFLKRLYANKNYYFNITFVI